MTDIVVASPSVEPITLAQAKLHIRETTAAQDALLPTYISAARAYAENFCTRALVLAKRRLLLDCFPSQIDILWTPLRAVQSIRYVDDAGVLQTLAADQYRVDKQSLPARITPAYEVTWPSTRAVTHAVRVDYTVGHLIPFTADAATDTLTAEGHGFEDTDQTMVATLAGSLPGGLSPSTNYHVRDAAANTLKLAATAGGAAIDITENGTAPNVLGSLHRDIELALYVLVQYFEGREANEKILRAAEMILGAHRVVRF